MPRRTFSSANRNQTCAISNSVARVRSSLAERAISKHSFAKRRYSSGLVIHSAKHGPERAIAKTTCVLCDASHTAATEGATRTFELLPLGAAVACSSGSVSVEPQRAEPRSSHGPEQAAHSATERRRQGGLLYERAGAVVRHFKVAETQRTRTPSVTTKQCQCEAKPNSNGVRKSVSIRHRVFSLNSVA